MNLFKALVDLPPEILNYDAGDRQRQESVEGQLGADLHHVDERPCGEHQRVGGIHDRRAEQHTDRIQVIGGARHDVAGAGSLVVGIGKLFQVLEKIVAQIEFDVARDANHNPAG